MSLRLIAVVAALAALASPLASGALGPTRRADVVVAPQLVQPGTAKNFKLVGHNPLFNRGMNSAFLMYKNFLYVGNRTDGSPKHPHPGVLILDIRDPRHPKVVGELGPPEEAQVGQTSRELHVMPDTGTLIVMNFRCSALIHDCPQSPDTYNIKFFDIRGANATSPKLIKTYVPSAKPHEMFIWMDPRRKGRALMYISTPTTSTDPAKPNILVADISHVRQGIVTEVGKANWNSLFTDAERKEFAPALHSMSVSPDGKRLFVAHLGGNFLVADSSDFANARPNPTLRLLTPPANRPRWTNPNGHSAVKLMHHPYAVVTDEVYGDLLDPGNPPGVTAGCPWGWLRVVNVANPAQPRIVGEFKLRENTDEFCASPAGRDERNTKWTSFAAHNPTVLRRLAIVSWHSGGLQAISLANPARPRQVGYFVPQPLASVATEDPALSSGNQKVVVWSYPVIRNGLIYVIDIRNGLYVLRYTGQFAADVRKVKWFDGNSNMGDAPRLDGMKMKMPKG